MKKLKKLWVQLNDENLRDKFRLIGNGVVVIAAGAWGVAAAIHQFGLDEATRRQQYVSIAVDAILDPESPPNMRDWAFNTINENSPSTMDALPNFQLGGGNENWDLTGADFFSVEFAHGRMIEKNSRRFKYMSEINGASVESSLSLFITENLPRYIQIHWVDDDEETSHPSIPELEQFYLDNYRQSINLMDGTHIVNPGHYVVVNSPHQMYTSGPVLAPGDILEVSIPARTRGVYNTFNFYVSIYNSLSDSPEIMQVLSRHWKDGFPARRDLDRSLTELPEAAEIIDGVSFELNGSKLTNIQIDSGQKIKVIVDADSVLKSKSYDGSEKFVIRNLNADRNLIVMKVDMLLFNK